MIVQSISKLHIIPSSISFQSKVELQVNPTRFNFQSITNLVKSNKFL